MPGNEVQLHMQVTQVMQVHMLVMQIMQVMHVLSSDPTSANPLATKKTCLAASVQRLAETLRSYPRRAACGQWQAPRDIRPIAPFALDKWLFLCHICERGIDI